MKGGLGKGEMWAGCVDMCVCEKQKVSPALERSRYTRLRAELVCKVLKASR